jgi:hypothetical protein
MKTSETLVPFYGTNDSVELVLKLGRALGWLAAWAWTIIASVGGLGLIITLGPLPLTNDWFAPILWHISVSANRVAPEKIRRVLNSRAEFVSASPFSLS